MQLETLAESTNVKILKEEIKKKESQQPYLQGSVQSRTRSPAQNLCEKHSASSRSDQNWCFTCLQQHRWHLLLGAALFILPSHQGLQLHFSLMC